MDADRAWTLFGAAAGRRFAVATLSAWWTLARWSSSKTLVALATLPDAAVVYYRPSS